MVNAARQQTCPQLCRLSLLVALNETDVYSTETLRQRSRDEQANSSHTP